MYSCSWNTISQLRSVTCHMGSHSVTFYPTQVNTPRPAEAQLLLHAVNEYSKRGNFGSTVVSNNMVLSYWPDGTNVYGSDCGEYCIQYNRPKLMIITSNIFSSGGSVMKHLALPTGRPIVIRIFTRGATHP